MPGTTTISREQVEGKIQASVGIRLHGIYRQRDDGTFTLMCLMPTRRDAHRMVKRLPKAGNYIIAVCRGTFVTEPEFDNGGCRLWGERSNLMVDALRQSETFDPATTEFDPSSITDSRLSCRGCGDD